MNALKHHRDGSDQDTSLRDLYRSSVPHADGHFASWTVDCSEKPKDLRPVRDRIMYHIREMQVAYPGEKIVVLMGEDHTVPSQSFLQQFVLASCLRQGIRIGFDREAPTSFKPLVYGGNFAPYAHQAKINFCKHYNIPVYVSDALSVPQGKQRVLRGDDPVVSRVRAVMGLSDFKTVNTASGVGIDIRNTIRAENIERRDALGSNAEDVLVVEAGASHVFNRVSAGGLPFFSLSNQLRVHGYRVLNVYPAFLYRDSQNCERSTYSDISPDADVSNTVFYHSMDMSSFDATNSNEARVLQDICVASGNEVPLCLP